MARKFRKIKGTFNSERIAGTNRSEYILGFNGNDYLDGKSGNDILDGGKGNDSLLGGKGNDIYIVDSRRDRIVEKRSQGVDTVQAVLNWTLGKHVDNLILTGRKAISGKGNNLNNRMTGNNNRNQLRGLGGNDVLDGRGGDDVLIGDDGNDTLMGGDGNDLLDGGTGNDQLSGDGGNDTLEGGTGNDILMGGSENDILNGDSENDTLNGGLGDDQLTGGLGDDQLFGGDGNDRLFGSEGNDLLDGGTSNDQLSGDAGSDTLEGGAGNDMLNGSTDNDVLNGGTENDTLNGGLGDDQLTGGLGDDQLFGEDGTDRLFGSDGNDLLDGGTGDDQLAGEAGNDTLIGGIGNDTLTGGSGQDVFVIGTGLGTETITDFRKGEDALQLAGDLTFDNLSIQQGSGGQQNDTIIQYRDTGELLAILQGISSQTIDRSDFGEALSQVQPVDQAKPLELTLRNSPLEVADGIWFLGSDIDPDNTVNNLSPTNIAAADTTNTDQLWSGGLLGLNLTGAGLTVGIWDGGHVRNTHQEFGTRVTIADAATPSYDDHATHVAGTIGAAGIQPTAHGMANAVKIQSYDWFNDLEEMRGAASQIAVSNHSYGSSIGWKVEDLTSEPWTKLGFKGEIDVWYGDRALRREDPDFGKYKDESADLDDILFNNPQLLSVWSAGNDRLYEFSNKRGDNTYITYLSVNPGITDLKVPWTGAGWYLVTNSGVTAVPNANNSDRGGGSDPSRRGYDTLGYSAAKNTLVVGAVDDITPDLYSVSQIKMTGFSSWGPTDDGRIKPDVVANGMGLYSPVATSDQAYDSYSGTSMAAPNVTGTTALLIQHYQNLYGSRPLSATSKGLLIHTASDAGNVGPDYQYGWGLVDAAAAANFLAVSKNAQSRAVIHENTLEAAKPENTETFTATTGHPLKVTIAWTDPAGTPHANGQLDQTTPVLVNDLNLWITDSKGKTYYPWTLNSANPSASAVRTGLNHVDNVEQVIIDAPVPGEKYTVHIGRTGTPFTQNYSLLISEIPKYATGITQLTYDQKDDLFPQIDGANLVWTQGIGNTGREIWRYNISDGTKLPLSPGNQAAKPTLTASNGETFTPTYVDHAGVQLSGNRVVWTAGILETGFNQDGTFQKGSDGKILTTIRRYPYYYDLNSKTGKRLSEDPIVGSPMIKGSHAVWFNADKVVEFYDLSKANGHLNYAPNAITTQQPWVSDNYAVWVGTNPNTGTDSEIFVYDFNSSQVKQLTDNSTSDLYPYISGSDIVWAGSDGQDYEIFHYNTEHPEKGIQQLTDNTINDSNPKVSHWSNNKVGVVWEGGNTANGTEIYYRSIDPITGQGLGTAIQLTTNDFYDGKLDIDGSRAVWVEGSAQAGNFNLFYRDLNNLSTSQNIQLTNQFGQEFPQISGSSVTWDGRPVGAFGSGVKEIFLANVDALTPVVA